MLQKLSSIVLTLALILFLSIHCRGQENDATKPNIIYILADDLGYGDLGCYGQEKIQTPNIDALAASGIKFTNHYSGSTVCAPSRATLMTGQHTGHVSVRGNREVQPEGQAPLQADEITIASRLQKAGYRTGAFGKWGLGFPGSISDPLSSGFDAFYGYNCQRLAHNYYPEYLWQNGEKVYLDGNEGSGKGDYAPTEIHRAALDFIEDAHTSPFFLFYPSAVPHAELAVPEAYKEIYRGKLTEGAPFNGVDEGPKFRNGGYGSQPEPRIAYAAMISLLDEQVGEIVALVKRLGIKDNTIILFSSDNGPSVEGGSDPAFFNSTGGLKGIKRDLYEGGLRVPLVASWPGKVKAGSTSDFISAQWDLMPTFCHIAGLPIPTSIDGISLLPTMMGQDSETHGFLYWEFAPRNTQAVRMGKWKAIQTIADKAKTGNVELYNLDIDRSETKNLASEHPEVVEEITAIMAREHTPSKAFPLGFEK